MVPVTRPERAPITRQRIAAAALELIDAEGMEALAMRPLAARLGIEAMSLYYHVPSRAALLDAVLEVLIAEIHLGDEGPWRARVRNAVMSMYAVSRTHPRAYELLAARRWNTPVAFRFYESLLTILMDEGGLDAHAAARAFRALGGYANGAALARVASAGLGPDASVVVLQSPSPPLEAYPHVAAVVPELRLERLDALFEETLDRMLTLFLESSLP